MDLGLKDKVAIVGGASMGIGYGIARTLAAEGARVALTARREAGLVARRRARSRSETGAEVLPVQADCRRAEDCARVVETVSGRLGGIDILVNNDGAPPLGDMQCLRRRGLVQGHRAEPDVRRAHGARVPCRNDQERGGGSILNITAISAIQPIPGFGAVGRDLVRRDRLRQDAVARGCAVTASTSTRSVPATSRRSGCEKVFAVGGRGSAGRARASCVERDSDGRIGTVDDIGILVALLVSPRGRYITGTAIQVDGGLLRAVR